MIAVKLMGGLGNQMFQYASAKALALHHHVPVCVDLSFLNANTNGEYTKRNYELNIFNLKELFPNKRQQKFISCISSNNLFNKLSIKAPILFPFSYRPEKSAAFQTDFFTYPKNTYLAGFWQSEKYFKKYELEIKNSFLFTDAPDKNNLAWIKKIQSCTSISIHIRRGDYITDNKTFSFHGICSNEYYRTALQYILSKVRSTSVELFLFSDDKEWGRKNLQFNYPTHIIDCNTGLKSYEDMRLMSLCQHNIIANSSFSWWGAWLNNNPSKIIAAPAKWFNDPNLNTNDIIPETWEKI